MKVLVAGINSLIGQQRKAVKENEKSSVALMTDYIRGQHKVTWMLNSW